MAAMSFSGICVLLVQPLLNRYMSPSVLPGRFEMARTLWYASRSSHHEGQQHFYGSFSIFNPFFEMCWVWPYMIGSGLMKVKVKYIIKRVFVFTASVLQKRSKVTCDWGLGQDSYLFQSVSLQHPAAESLIPFSI